MARTSHIVCGAGLVAIATATLAYGQAGAVVKSMAIPDVRWIEQQCASFVKKKGPDDAARRALQLAQVACNTYNSSPRDQDARDAWIRQMLAIQNDVGPGAARLVLPRIGGELPADFDSYSLFLVPDHRWRNGKLAGNARPLWNAFSDFGRDIGDERVALWFEDQEGNVDVLRSQEYCRQFKLNYNAGPYIVTVRKRPDLLQVGDEVLVIRLGGISIDGIVNVLNVLSQDLLGPTPRPRRVLYEEIKQRALTRYSNNKEPIWAFVTQVAMLMRK